MGLTKGHYSPLGRPPSSSKELLRGPAQIAKPPSSSVSHLLQRDNYRGAKRINVVKSGRRKEQ